MTECRFFPWCSCIEDHGCAKDRCDHYQPMPDVDALLALADEMENAGYNDWLYNDEWESEKIANRIRKALGLTMISDNERHNMV